MLSRETAQNVTEHYQLVMRLWIMCHWQATLDYIPSYHLSPTSSCILAHHHIMQNFLILMFQLTCC